MVASLFACSAVNEHASHGCPPPHTHTQVSSGGEWRCCSTANTCGWHLRFSVLPPCSNVSDLHTHTRTLLHSQAALPSATCRCVLFLLLAWPERLPFVTSEVQGPLGVIQLARLLVASEHVAQSPGGGGGPGQSTPGWSAGPNGSSSAHLNALSARLQWIVRRVSGCSVFLLDSQATSHVCLVLPARGRGQVLGTVHDLEVRHVHTGEQGRHH